MTTTDQQYIEFRARLMADPVFLRHVVAGFQKEVMTKVVHKRESSGITVLVDPPPGYITYAQAAEMVGVRADFIRRQVSHSHYSGSGGFLCEGEFRNYIMTQSRKRTREHLVKWDADQEAKAKRGKVLRMGEGRPVLDLFEQTA